MGEIQQKIFECPVLLRKYKESMHAELILIFLLHISELEPDFYSPPPIPHWNA